MNREPVPGTFSPGYVEAALTTVGVSGRDRRRHSELGIRGYVAWAFGECRVWRFLDDGGLHLGIAHDERDPSWDEIKVARYRLLPLDRTYALMLPPPGEYVDTPDNPHLFELTEVA